MYDPLSDDLRPLSVIAREIPNRDGSLGVNVSSVWRWTLKGLKGARLRSKFCGGIRMSCGRWVDEFFSRVTAAADGTAQPEHTDRQRERALREAEAELDAAGIR